MEIESLEGELDEADTETLLQGLREVGQESIGILLLTGLALVES